MHLRRSFIFALFLTVLGGSVFWYHLIESRCNIPLAYDIGEVDPRFHISKEEISLALKDAKSLWETATGKALFTYKPGAHLLVNFVYDTRQDVTTKEGAARQKLDQKQEISKQLRADYQNTVSQYDRLKKEYANSVAEYEKDLETYNKEVAQINEGGGAHPEEFTHLEKEKKDLAKKQTALNATAHQMNVLVQSINTLGEQGNRAVTDYNQEVVVYNNAFGYAREFTQGDYQGNRINIYQFNSPVELRNVLAHELGHALSLEHVKDPKAIMYYLMDEQSATSSVVTGADLAEFDQICGNSKFTFIWSNPFLQFLGDRIRGISNINRYI